MKQLLADFKKFITRGNVIDLAVAVVIGTAFTPSVTLASSRTSSCRSSASSAASPRFDDLTT